MLPEAKDLLAILAGKNAAANITTFNISVTLTKVPRAIKGNIHNRLASKIVNVLLN